MKIRVYATLQAIAGDRDLDIPVPHGATVRELVLTMVERWPEMEELLLSDGEVSRRVHVYIDGRSSRHLPDGADTALHEGDEIVVAPAVAGG